MCPSLCAQIGRHEEQLIKSAGITPIPTLIGRDWKCLDVVSIITYNRLRPSILMQLRTPRTFAMLEGDAATGFLWWADGWVWERWHWGRWPVEVVRGSLLDIARRAGADPCLIMNAIDAFERR